MRTQAWIAAALLAGALGGCGTPTWTLFYKPLVETRVQVPFPSACEKRDGVEVYVGPQALRRMEGALGENSGRQEFVVEILVRNGTGEVVRFRSQDVTIDVEGKSGRPVEAVEQLINPGEHTGRYELHVPVTGRGKPDARDDTVMLTVAVQGVTSGKTIAVPVRLLFTVSQAW